MKKSMGAKTLIYPTPVWCVGSFDKEGKPNVMTIAWGGICCSNPPCVNISLRKSRYSYSNIMERKAFTLSVPSAPQAAIADYFGMASGKNVDKFAESRLTAVESDIVDAPYVGEFPMILECELIHHHDLGAHTLLVGEIKDVKVEDHLLDSDGKPDIEKIKPVVFSPEAQKYHGIGKLIGNAFKMGKAVGPLK